MLYFTLKDAALRAIFINSNIIIIFTRKSTENSRIKLAALREAVLLD